MRERSYWIFVVARDVKPDGSQGVTERDCS